MRPPSWRLTLVTCWLLWAACATAEMLSLNQPWVHEAAAVRPLSADCRPGLTRGACVGLVGIFSHPYFTERRMRIRSTWLQYRTPGLDFVFVLGLPKLEGEPNSLVESFVKRESAMYRDIVFVNVSEQDSHSSDAAKGWAWFTWASMLGQGHYQFVAKADDDNIINPYQLRLMLTSLPSHQRVFWGRPLMKTGWPSRIHIGTLYLMSYDLAAALGQRTHAQFVHESNVSVSGILEDLRMSNFMRSLVPADEWVDAKLCEIYDHPDPAGKTEFMYPYNNQTIAVHQVKEHYYFIEAFATLLPYMDAMQHDCMEWNGSAADSGAPHSQLPVPACRRWYQDTCLTPAGQYTQPDPPAFVRPLHHSVALMVLFMASLSGAMIAATCAWERYGGCARLCP